MWSVDLILSPKSRWEKIEFHQDGTLSKVGSKKFTIDN